MAKDKTFADFTREKLSEGNEEIPPMIKAAAEALEEYEKKHGTEATFRLVEMTCMEEISKNFESDPKYVEYLLNFLHDAKKTKGQSGN